MKKIRVLNKFNKIRVNKGLRLKSPYIFDKYGIKINNFLGYIDLFYNLKDEMPDLDNFNDEINLKFKLFNKRINNFSHRNILIEKIKKEYINENNGFNKEELHNHIHVQSLKENKKYDSFYNKEIIKNRETNNINNRNINWNNSYERRSFENITFNKSNVQNNKKENKIYLNRHYGDLKNHLWVRNIGELYFNKNSTNKVYSNEMIDIKQYPFLEKRIIDNDVVNNYLNENIDGIVQKDNYFNEKKIIPEIFHGEIFGENQNNFKFVGDIIHQTQGNTYWRNIKESENIKIENDLSKVKNHFIKNINEGLNKYMLRNIFLSTKSQSIYTWEKNSHESITKKSVDIRSFGETSLFNKYEWTKKENRFTKFSRDILGENIVFVDENSYEIFGGESNSVLREQLAHYSVHEVDYHMENIYDNPQSNSIKNFRNSFYKNSSNLHSRYERRIIENILNLKRQSIRLENQIYQNDSSYLEMNWNNKNEVMMSSFNISKKEFNNYKFIEKIILKEYLKSLKRDVLNKKYVEEYEIHHGSNKGIDLNTNIINKSYLKYLSSLIDNRKSRPTNIILKDIQQRYWKRNNYTYNMDNSKHLSVLGETGKNNSVVSKLMRNSFNIDKISSFSSNLFNSIHAKNVIKNIWNSNESRSNNSIQNSEVVYKINENFEEVNKEINELRLGNEIIINNNRRLSRIIENENKRVFSKKYLKEENSSVIEREETRKSYKEEKKYFEDSKQYIQERNISLQFNNEIQNYRELLNRQEKIINRNSSKDIWNAFKQEEKFYRLYNEVFTSNIGDSINVNMKNVSLEQEYPIEIEIENNEDNSRQVQRQEVNNSYIDRRKSEFKNEGKYETFIERVQKLLNYRILSSREIFNSSAKNIFINEMATGIGNTSLKYDNSYKNNYYNSFLQGNEYNYKNNSYYNKTAAGDHIEELKEIINYREQKNYAFSENNIDVDANLIKNMVNNVLINKGDSYKEFIMNRSIFAGNHTKIVEALYKKNIIEILNHSINKLDKSYIEKRFNVFNRSFNNKTMNTNAIHNLNSTEINTFDSTRQEEKNIYDYKKSLKINDIDKSEQVNNIVFNKNIDLNFGNTYEESIIEKAQNSIKNSMVSNRRKTYINKSGTNINKIIYNIIKNRDLKVLRDREYKESVYKDKNINNYVTKTIENFEDNSAHSIGNYKKYEYHKSDRNMEINDESYEEIKKYNNVTFDERNKTEKKIFNENIVKRETLIKNQVDNLEKNYDEIKNELNKMNVDNSVRTNNNVKAVQKSSKINSVNVKNESLDLNYRSDKTLLNNVKKDIRNSNSNFIKNVENSNTKVNLKKIIEEEKIKNETINNTRVINEKYDYFGESNNDEYNTRVLRNNVSLEDKSMNLSTQNHVDKIENIQKEVKKIESKFKVHNINVKMDGNTRLKKVLESKFINLMNMNPKFLEELHASGFISSNDYINKTSVLNLRGRNSVKKGMMPFNGYKKNILRMSNINALDKSISLNVKNSDDNYENHTFKQVKNVILSNDGNDIGNNYDYATEIIFKKEENKVNQEEILNMISQNQKNMEVEIRNIIDKKIKKQGEEISVPTLSSQVYRDIERKMKYEKRRKGMI